VLDPVALQSRLANVRARIARAAGRAGRQPSAVRLVAISKTFPSEDVRAAAAGGQVDFGENRVQEALTKIAGTGDLHLRWHLVGHLQDNKVRKAAAAFDVVHSVDSAALVARLDQAAASEGRRIELLVQVDLAGEPTKYGVKADALDGVLDAGLSCRAARLCGLMLLPPAVSDPEDARPHFAALRNLRDRLVSRGVPAASLAELSMGMSHDFEVAVEEGATIVRVGSAIFAPRPVPRLA
jgi:PLP dependent protein